MLRNDWNPSLSLFLLFASSMSLLSNRSEAALASDLTQASAKSLSLLLLLDALTKASCFSSMTPKLAKMSFFLRSKFALPSEDKTKADDDEEEEEEDVGEVVARDVPCRMLRRFSTVIESENAVDGKEGGGMKSPPPGMVKPVVG